MKNLTVASPYLGNSNAISTVLSVLTSVGSLGQGLGSVRVNVSVSQTYEDRIEYLTQTNF